LGATILVAILIYLLAQISVVPVVGDFVESVIQEVQSVQKDDPASSPSGKESGLMDKFNNARGNF
jgi:hypothetical protein